MPQPGVAGGPLAFTVVVTAVPERPPGRVALRHRPAAVRTRPLVAVLIRRLVLISLVATPRS